MSHLTEDQLTLLYYGEAAPNETSHAQLCAECRARLQTFTRFMNAMRDVPAAEPSVDFQQRLWSRMRPQVTQILTRRKPFWSRGWFLGPALAAAFAAVFFSGMYFQNRFDRSHPESFSPKSRERVLLITVGDHLDRSQIVLAELAHAPDGNISAEQQLATRLVGENRLLRQAALHSGDASDAALLDQLERVLLDVANSPGEVSSQELKDLQERIEAQGLLFKVRVVSAADREKGMKL